jgi:hypothetical protein
VVLYACNPSYLGGGGRRITVQGQLRQKCKTLSKKLKSKRCWGHGSNSRAPAKQAGKVEG